MSDSPRTGLLPLYLAFYDEVLPDLRRELETFLGSIITGLRLKGLDVVAAPICRVQSEFARAVADLKADGAEAIVCLHLAYSPSLESADVLAACDLPLILLDTTPDVSFGQDVDPARLLYNHGVHGVQDLASLLRRRGRKFAIAAGHWQDSDVLDRVAELVRAARAARRFRRSRVLRVGQAFAGMGDFAVEEGVLSSRLGIRVAQKQAADLVPLAAAVTEEEIRAEIAADAAAFDLELPAAVHEYSVRAGLALRRMIEQSGATDLTMNFQAFDRSDGPLCTVPFAEASKAMGRGVGYAGEGDAVTSAMVGALLAAWPRTTFTEIFCPDWAGGSLFLSHMGEINPAVAADKPLMFEKDYPFSPACNPATIACAPSAGPATFVNLAPGPEGRFGLIVAPVEVLGGGKHPDMARTVRGWIRPESGLINFLEEFSRQGGTHHSALVLGDHAEALQAFAEFAGLEFCLI